MDISIWCLKNEGVMDPNPHSLCLLANFSTGSECAVAITDRAGIPKAFLDTNLLRYSTWTWNWAPPPVKIESKHFGLRNRYVSDGEDCSNAECVDNTIDITNFLSLFMGQYSTWETEAATSQSLSVFNENGSDVDGSWSVERSRDTNAVILQSRTGEEEGSFFLAHLPRMHNNEQKFVSLLKFSENDGWVRLVWNQGPQKSYSCQDPINPYLPCIISRKSETIEYQPGYKTLKRSAEGESGALVKKRLSGIWRDEEDGTVKRGT
jgi:hypothetical protein